MVQLQGFRVSAPLKVTNGDKHKKAIRRDRRKTPLKISKTFQNTSVKNKISLLFRNLVNHFSLAPVESGFCIFSLWS